MALSASTGLGNSGYQSCILRLQVSTGEMHPAPSSASSQMSRAWMMVKYWPKPDNDNDFMFAYVAQRTNQRYSGLPGIWPQDSGMQQSMGLIYDRTKEHLGSSDSGQIRIRRRMLNAARALRKDGTPPPGVEDPGVFHLRPVEAVLLRSTASWVDATRELYRVEGAVKGLGTPASK